MTAIISPCGKYRYLLKRPREVMNPMKGTALFVMLNPSTADANLDDPTIRRCRGFAKRWDCNGIVVANLYAYRATDPRELVQCVDPVGPENNSWLEALALEFEDVVFAWGANADPDRVRRVVQIFNGGKARLWCLGTTKSGAPRHPLYVRGDQPLVLWEPPA